MRALSIAGALAIIAVLSGCSGEVSEVLPDGVYREPSGVETISVSGQHCRLTLNVTKGPRLGLQSREYEYDVSKDRHLSFVASSNDSFFVFTVLNYDWMWDGKNVIRKHEQTGEIVVFSRGGEDK